jgi:hypothetical protein
MPKRKAPPSGEELPPSKLDAYRALLSDYQKSGARWLSVDLDQVADWIELSLERAAREGRPLTLREARVDLHFAMNKGEVPGINHWVERWDWSEYDVRELFRAVGLHQKRGKKTAKNSVPKVSQQYPKGVPTDPEISVNSGKSIPTVSQGYPNGIPKDSPSLYILYTDTNNDTDPPFIPPADGRESGEKAASPEAVKVEPPQRGKRRSKATKVADGEEDLGGIREEEIPERLRTLEGEVDGERRAFLEVWRGWVHWRRYEKRNRITRSTAERQLRKLAKADDPLAMLERSISHGWTGLFEGGDNDGTGTKQAPRPAPQGRGGKSGDYGERREYASKEYDPDAWTRFGESLRSLDGDDGTLPGV